MATAGPSRNVLTSPEHSCHPPASRSRWRSAASSTRQHPRDERRRDRRGPSTAAGRRRCRHARPPSRRFCAIPPASGLRHGPRRRSDVSSKELLLSGLALAHAERHGMLGVAVRTLCPVPRHPRPAHEAAARRRRPSFGPAIASSARASSSPRPATQGRHRRELGGEAGQGRRWWGWVSIAPSPADRPGEERRTSARPDRTVLVMSASSTRPTIWRR